MNGNANLNANNLTEQNIKDWRKKLGITGNPAGIESIRTVGQLWGPYNGTSRTATTTYELEEGERITSAWAIPFDNGGQYSNGAIWSVSSSVINNDNTVSWTMRRYANDGTCGVYLYAVITKFRLD